jgi:GT2 family glycosyltransferase
VALRRLVTLVPVDHHGPVPRPKVRLVVLNYNGGALTLRCLRHLEALEWPPDRLDLVVVDNASVDGSVAEIRRAHPGVRVVETGANLGFPANNVGLRDLDADIAYAGLVNNDAFVEPGWLEPLVATLESSPDVGAAASKILFAPRFRSVHVAAPPFHQGGGDPRELGVEVLGLRVAGEDRWRSAQPVSGCYGFEPGLDGPFTWTSASGEIRVPLGAGDPAEAELRLRRPQPAQVTISSGDAVVVVEVGPTASWFTVPVQGEPYDVVNNAGSVVFSDGYGADRGYLEVDRGQYDAEADVFAWCGASVLFRREYLDHVGLLEDRFFMYYEDTDLSWRGRACGWRHRYVPTSVVRHVHAATAVEGSDFFAHHVERNRLLLLARNAPLGLVLGQTVRFLLVTASYARRDIVGRLVRRERPLPAATRRRARSFLAYLSMLPWALRERRRLHRRQVVSRAALRSELLPR